MSNLTNEYKYHSICSLTVFQSVNEFIAWWWHRMTPCKLSNLCVFFSHLFLSHSSSSLSLPKIAMAQQTYHKCFIMFYREMFGCSGLHCILFTGAASLPQLWLGSPASGFKRLAAKQAVGRDHQTALWLLPLWRWWLLRWLIHFAGWYSQCLVAGRHLLIYSLASPHANLPWREHHSFSAPCSASSTCCQCHPHQPGTKHQCHLWRKLSAHGWFPSAQWRVAFCISATLAESSILLFFWKM